MSLVYAFHPPQPPASTFRTRLKAAEEASCCVCYSIIPVQIILQTRQKHEFRGAGCPFLSAPPLEETPVDQDLVAHKGIRGIGRLELSQWRLTLALLVRGTIARVQDRAGCSWKTGTVRKMMVG